MKDKYPELRYYSIEKDKLMFYPVDYSGGSDVNYKFCTKNLSYDYLPGLCECVQIDCGECLRNIINEKYLIEFYKNYSKK